MASAPGVRAKSLAGVAQMVFVAHHVVGATTMAGARDSVASSNNLQRPGAATRHALAYALHNVGKEQWADMGPATMRFGGKGPYKPKPGGRREQLLAQWGRVQLPYLEDANTGEKMFESAKIIAYLEHHYAR